MKSLELQYVSGLIDNSVDTKKGKTATVSIVTVEGKKYAFKKYRLNAVENLAAMENHICSLFDCLGESNYNEMMLFGAFPKYLVYNQGSFCGFLMDRIPRECYTGDHQDRHLGTFYGIAGEVNRFSDKQIGQYVKNLGNLIYDLHENGFILGDALNDQNLYVRVINNQLYPYLVDTDSLRKDQANPAKTYHSPNFEPPEGEDSPSSKESDIYKYCLIVLRLFAKPEKEYERAGLRIEDSDSANSLQRIQETLGDDYKNIIIKGLLDNPSKRPQIREVLQAFSPKKNLEDDDDKAVAKVQRLIDSIGKVTFTEECEKKIRAARFAFSNLTVPQRLLVPEYKLRKAETEYDALKRNSKAKQPLKTGNIEEDQKKRLTIAMAVNVIFAIVNAAILYNQAWFVSFISHSWIALIFTTVLYSTSNFIADVQKWRGEVDKNSKWYDSKRRWSFIGSTGVILACGAAEAIMFRDAQTILQKSWWNLLLLAAVFVGLFLQNINEFSDLGDYWLEKDQSKKIKTTIYGLGIAIIFLFCIGFGFGVSHVRNSVSVSDTITLGSYEQDGNLDNGSEALTWTVHEIEDGKALLLCDTCIAAMPYNKDNTDNSWTNSNIRNWLNEDFYKSAFSSDEAGIVADVKVVTGRLIEEEGATSWETYGKDELTTDKIFVPDFSQYWKLKNELDVSEVAKADFMVNNIKWGQENYQTMFWLRNPYGESKSYATGYNTENEDPMGYVFYPKKYAFVRPAMYIDVSLYSNYINQSATSKLQMTARLKGEKKWTDVVQASVGDEIEFQIEYRNLQKDTVDNVMIRDVLPTNIQYIEGTTYLFNSNYEDGILLEDDMVATSGINIGSYDAQANAYVRFSGKVVDVNLAAGDNQLVNWANVTVTDTVYKDDVSVMVNISK